MSRLSPRCIYPVALSGSIVVTALCSVGVFAEGGSRKTNCTAVSRMALLTTMTAQLSLGKQTQTHSSPVTPNSRPVASYRHTRQQSLFSLGGGHRGKPSQSGPKPTQMPTGQGHRHGKQPKSGKGSQSAIGKIKGSYSARESRVRKTVSAEGGGRAGKMKYHYSGGKAKRAYTVRNSKWQPTTSDYLQREDWQLSYTSVHPTESTVEPTKEPSGDSQVIIVPVTPFAEEPTRWLPMPTGDNYPDTEGIDSDSTVDQERGSEPGQSTEGTIAGPEPGFRGPRQWPPARINCIKPEHLHIKCRGFTLPAVCNGYTWQGTCTHNGTLCQITLSHAYGSVFGQTVTCGNCQIQYDAAHNRLIYVDLSAYTGGDSPTRAECPEVDLPLPWPTPPAHSENTSVVSVAAYTFLCLSPCVVTSVLCGSCIACKILRCRGTKKVKPSADLDPDQPPEEATSRASSIQPQELLLPLCE